MAGLAGVGLVYLALGFLLLPLTIGFLWTGIRAFRALRRLALSFKACPGCGREIINPEASHCGKCGRALVAHQ
jgi:hypothetical protein